MDDQSWQQRLPGYVATLRIIVIALILGALTFVAIAIGVRASGDGFNTDVGFMTGMAIAVACIMLILQPLVVSQVTRSLRQQVAQGTWSTASQRAGQPQYTATDGDRLASVYTSRTIIAVAMLEGVAFFCGTVILIEGSLFALAIAIALAFFIALRIPSTSRMQDWIETQFRRMNEEKMLAR